MSNILITHVTFSAWCQGCGSMSHDMIAMVHGDECPHDAIERVLGRARWSRDLCPDCAPANDAALRGDDDAKAEREDSP